MKVFGIDIVMKTNHLQGQVVHENILIFLKGILTLLKATVRSFNRK